ncbi:MAG: hypothetical protein LPK07_07820, partial [Hymenobacteraceae bacterium]|nr:hypothetical protein [Hymenobacteraceae bacterium]
VSVTSIQINWTDANAFEVKVDGPDLEWVVKLKNTTSTSLLNLLSNMLPQNAWKSEAVVSNMERVASNMLHAGSLTLAGKAPNGQHFIAKPNLVTLVDTSKALLRGKDLGHVAKLPQQARIGQFCIPTKGLFMLGQLYFEPFDPDNHDLVMHIHTSL